MQEFMKVLKSWNDFSNRARRREYWMFVLYYFILSVVVGIVDSILGTSGVLVSLLSLAILVPSIAVSIRRMHDIGKSGYWILINFVPLIGGLWFLWLSIQDSQPGTNQYGPNPKGL